MILNFWYVTEWLRSSFVDSVVKISAHIWVFVCMGFVRFGALEEVFMSYTPHGAWRTMEVLKELA
jgi:hypothetical protein